MNNDAFFTTYPVGAHVLIRDAEWRITAVDMTTNAGARLTCVGVSEIVRDRLAMFFEAFESSIEVLRPEQTRIIEDHSSHFIKSKLYLEALLRAAPKTDPSKLYSSIYAAMDPLPYQFSPALQALKSPRARILIADAVGIGKTLEAGILVSELIARGRGRRILVLATKAMLFQFQQEFWNRFSIPLACLDSSGIRSIRNRIPANQNPFFCFDKAIISIDTLKRNVDYQAYLEEAYWDIIIIDEAHNVAMRNTGSQRAKLAKLLSSRSDSLIMLTATPHDGKAESFASLLNILDPTAIADPSQYTLDDFADKGLVIRRFKSDIRDQVSQDFPEREINKEEIVASNEEIQVYNYLSNLTFNTLDDDRALGARLFSTVLIKAFFSSPAACSSVVQHRMNTLEVKRAKLTMGQAKGIDEDLEKLKKLQLLLKAVTVDKFSKLQYLASMLQPSGKNYIGWTPKDSEDRLVIFTESLETLAVLEQNLPDLTGLKEKQIITLSGKMSDVEIDEKVNDFGSGSSKVRLLLCSDVASEGINLHHFSHRMIHFDIPWSLLVFQQRNGRIDRYGQTKQPQIWYLLTKGTDSKSIGDAHVLEKLIEKDEQAQKNLSDPAEFLPSEESQIQYTQAQMEGHEDEFEEDDVLADLFDDDEGSEATKIASVLTKQELQDACARNQSLFKNDMDYAKAILRFMSDEPRFKHVEKSLNEEHRLILGLTPDLKARISNLPSEIVKDDHFVLVDDRKKVQDEMNKARSLGDDWPNQQLLWAQHPVMQYLQDLALGIFGKQSAPLLRLSSIPAGERWYLIQGGYPNRSGFIPVHCWCAVNYSQGNVCAYTLEEFLNKFQLKSELANQLDSNGERDCSDSFDKKGLKEAVELVKEKLHGMKNEFESQAQADLKVRLEDLEALRRRHEDALNKRYESKRYLDNKLSEIDKHFKHAKGCVQNNATLEDEPYMLLCAVFCGLYD